MAFVSPDAATSQSTDEAAALESFLDEMSDKHGFAREDLARVFDHARFRSRIVALMDKQTKRKPWEDYRGLFVTAQKIRAGVRFWSENAPKLALASERYGVPEEVIVSILGIETHYGRNTGSFKVLDALMTLAFQYPKRAELFREELEHFLLLAREESISLDASEGSYAGAMGIAQFMPGSYRRYAVDFDGDGKRDLFDNASDAIGSVANYLTAYGWQRDEPIAAPAVLGNSGRETFENAELTTRVTLHELSQRDITANGAFSGSQEAIPLTLARSDGPEYWLGFTNFYVITRYNHSVYYAMAVYQLSRELREARTRNAD